MSEGWNNSFAQLVGHSHPFVLVLIEGLQQDQAMIASSIIQNVLGQPPIKKVKKSTELLQIALVTLCTERRDGVKSIDGDLLDGCAHYICLVKSNDTI